MATFQEVSQPKLHTQFLSSLSELYIQLIASHFTDYIYLKLLILKRNAWWFHDFQR